MCSNTKKISNEMRELEESSDRIIKNSSYFTINLIIKKEDVDIESVADYFIGSQMYSTDFVYIFKNELSLIFNCLPENCEFKRSYNTILSSVISDVAKTEQCLVKATIIEFENAAITSIYFGWKMFENFKMNMKSLCGLDKKDFNKTQKELLEIIENKGFRSDWDEFPNKNGYFRKSSKNYEIDPKNFEKIMAWLT